ncbi:MAG: hypothetical protein QM483_10485 [Desulfuromusa sp.]
MKPMKVLAISFLLFGLLFLVVGISQIGTAKTPNTCIVSFAKSLGGKASFELDQSVQKCKALGIAGISFGVVFTLAGGALLLKAKK